MGTSGAGIFSDDIAADVRSSYRELIEDGLEAAAASRHIVEGVIGNLDPDDAVVAWLALAAAQSGLGRLQSDVRERALQIIEGGEGLSDWVDLGARAMRERKAALDRLHKQLTGPQPDPRPIRRTRRFETDLSAGDVLLFRSASNRLAILHVDGLSDTRYGLEPCLSWLDWNGEAQPSEVQLQPVVEAHRRGIAAGSRRPTWKVGRVKSSEPTWSDVGFWLVRAPSSAALVASDSWSVSTSWSMLAVDLERSLLNQAPDEP